MYRRIIYNLCLCKYQYLKKGKENQFLCYIAQTIMSFGCLRLKPPVYKYNL